jgi:glycerol-3-phosphate dehydrogenase
VFDGKRFPLKQAIYFDTPDKRMIFAIPRDGKTYVGTTDTVYEGEIAEPRMTVGDRDYVIKAINDMFPSVGITAADVESSWAGLRPLIHEEGKSPSEISRKDEIFVSDSGLMSIAGGKLTGYRKMAEGIIDLVAKQLKEEEGIIYSGAKTEHLPISGGDVGGSKGFEVFLKQKLVDGQALGLDATTAELLIRRYGSNVDVVFEIYKNSRKVIETHNNDPIMYAMLRYAIDYELAYKPVDFFIRRTGALFFDIHWVIEHKEAAINILADEFGWSSEQINEYTLELDKQLDEARNPVVEI